VFRLKCGRSAELSGGDGCSAVSAEGGGGVEGVIARRAEGARRRRRKVGTCAAEDLARDVEGLGGVVLADATRHEEALDEPEDGGDTGPKEDEVKDAGCISAQIEVMSAEDSKEESEEDADDLVLVGALVLGVEPGALLVGHVYGIERIGDLHDFVPLAECLERYA